MTLGQIIGVILIGIASIIELAPMRHKGSNPDSFIQRLSGILFAWAGILTVILSD